MADLNELLAGAMNQEPVLGKSEIKAIGLAVISNNLAIAARRGRPLFMSNVARDVNSLNGIAAGGLDLNSLLMLQMMEGGGVGDPETKSKDIEAVLKEVVDRLDDLENVATRKGK